MRSLENITQRGWGRISKLLPGRISGPLDWYLFPKQRDPLLGPFNGQKGRIEIFRQILASVPFAALVETGTYRGATTAFLRRNSGLPVYTIEASSRNFHCARQRFKGESGIHSEKGDSCQFLEKLGRKRDPNGPVFFYLDAHWYQVLPLAEELEIITRYWDDPVIMIDDFEVPGDLGYSFDDYGPDKRLSVSYFSAEILRDYALFWPAMRGEEETGLRRGCVVMCRQRATEEKLAKLSSLRKNAMDLDTAR